VKTIVTFEFDSPAEAAAVLRNLTTSKEEAAPPYLTPPNTPKPAPPPKAEAAAKTEAAAATSPTAATAPTAAPAAPAADAAALLKEVQERVGKLVGAQRREEAATLLAKYGAAKASEVPIEKRAECKAELDALLMAG
jgi:hypothetical protein